MGPGGTLSCHANEAVCIEFVFESDMEAEREGG